MTWPDYPDTRFVKAVTIIPPLSIKAFLSLRKESNPWLERLFLRGRPTPPLAWLCEGTTGRACADAAHTAGRNSFAAACDNAINFYLFGAVWFIYPSQFIKEIIVYVTGRPISESL
jgi:hypothetical protein